MVPFFGILTPGRLRRTASEEAPAKANFFGGMPDPAQGAVPLSRAEQDACYLAGKGPEPLASEPLPPGRADNGPRTPQPE